jgi:HK97 family phage major capsid protein
MTAQATAAATAEEQVAQGILGEVDKRIAAGVGKELDARESKLVEKIAASVGKVFAEAKDKSRTDNGGDGGQHGDTRKFVIPGLHADSKEVQEYSFGRAIQAVIEGNPEKTAPLEWDLHKQAMKYEGEQMFTLPPWMRRNLATNPDSQVGILIPAQVLSSQVIPLLQAQSVMFGLGVNRIPGLTGSPAWLPKATSGTTAFWVDHDTTTDPTAVTRSNPKFGQIKMEPHQLASAVEISNRTINLSSPAIEALVRRQIARDMSLEIDRAIMNGSGTAGEPTGIMQRAGINTVAIGGSLMGSGVYDKLIDMQTLVEASNVVSQKFGWLMNPKHKGAIRKIKDPTDNSQPKERRIMTDGPGKALLEYPYAVTTQCPEDTLLFAAFDFALVGEWGSMFIAVDSQSVNRKFTTSVLVGMEVDTNVEQELAFCTGTGITLP